MGTMTPGQARAFWQQQEQRNPMSDDLKRMLDLVWTNRGRPDAYGLYIRQGRAIGSNLTSVRRFLVDLEALGTVPEVQESLTSGLGLIVRNLYQGYQAPNHGFVTMPQAQWSRLVRHAQRYDDLATMLSKTFFHFRSPAPGASGQRIYLHVTVSARAAVMGFLLQNVCILPSVSNAKVAPPSATMRFDTIVIYLSDEAAVNTALARIAEYQKGHRGLFEHGSPRLLKIISEFNGVQLVGVATGAEPRFDVAEQNGQLVRVNRPSSFGTIRGTIIEYCLNDILADPGAGKQDFIDFVIQCFNWAGIDPRKPFNG